jgi:hypothetical protein
MGSVLPPDRVWSQPEPFLFVSVVSFVVNPLLRRFTRLPWPPRLARLTNRALGAT